MELLLNLVWLAVSAGLGVALVVSRRGHGAAPGNFTHSRAAVWISYLLLVAFLLPAISMTDDLMAMTAPSDGEQVVRRYDVPAVTQAPILVHVASFFGVGDTAVSTPVWIAQGMVSVPELLDLKPLIPQPTQSRAPPIAL